MIETLQPVVYVVDDDAAVRDALKRLFLSVNMRVKVFASGTEFLENYQHGEPGCLISDIRMPGMSGMELQREMNVRDINLPIIMITGHGDIETGIRAMKTGAFDFLQKPFNDQNLLELVNLAIEKSEADIEHSQNLSLLHEKMDSLSGRERQVLDLIVEGVPNKRIAEQLGLSHKTVEFHRANIMKKMEMKTLAELIRKTIIANRD